MLLTMEHPPQELELLLAVSRRRELLLTGGVKDVVGQLRRRAERLPPAERPAASQQDGKESVKVRHQHPVGCGPGEAWQPEMHGPCNCSGGFGSCGVAAPQIHKSASCRHSVSLMSHMYSCSANIVYAKGLIS
jgi:hypothetical protein